MDYAPLTSLICPEFGIAWHTCTNLTFDYGPIEEAMSVERTWNGEAEDMSDPAFDLYYISLKSSGPGEMRAPALDRLRRRDKFTLIPTFEFVDLIDVGETMRSLIRDPHVPSLRVRDARFNDIPFTLDGRVITLSAPATVPVSIYYCPILKLKVFREWKETYVENETEVSWELYCEEVGGPDE